MRVLAAVLALLLLAGCVSMPFGSRRECPDPHWHATFGIFIPGEDGSPRRVDFGAPRTPTGQHHHDWDTYLAGGGNRQLSTTLHMHQAASSPETGGAGLGPSQWHMEQANKCISVKSGLHVIEVDATEDSLELWGEHAQVPGQAGTFTANSTSPLRWWVQTDDGCGPWVWREWSWSDLDGYQLKDGESFMGALGNYTPEQVKQMQDQVPPPSSRPPVPTPCPTPEVATPTPAANTTQPDGNATAPPGNGTA